MELGQTLRVVSEGTGGGTDAAIAALESQGAVLESFGLQGAGAHSDNAEFVLIGSID